MCLLNLKMRIEDLIETKKLLVAQLWGLALVIESRYTHGIGKVIYSLDSIRSCSVIPVSDEENEK